MNADNMNYVPLYLNDPPEDMNGSHHTIFAKVSRVTAQASERVVIVAHGKTFDDAYNLASGKADEWIEARVGATLDDLT